MFPQPIYIDIREAYAARKQKRFLRAVILSLIASAAFWILVGAWFA